MSVPVVGAILPAAGFGVRLGLGAPKALRALAGEPLLVHAVRGLRACPAVGPIVVAAPPAGVAEVRAMLAGFARLTVVPGGTERQDSVRAALAELPPGAELVLVHDAARCLTPVRVVEAVLAALVSGAEAVVPVLAVTDTVKVVQDDRVTATVDRSCLRAVQTPQGFVRAVLERAYADPTVVHTDDAGLVAALGVEVRTVAGDERALKITRPFDLLVADAVLAGETL